MDIKHGRRSFCKRQAFAGVAAAVGEVGSTPQTPIPIRISAVATVFELTSSLHIVWKRIRLLFLPTPRGLSDSEMEALARETNLQETTFIFPRAATTERQEGVKVRIFVPSEEISLGGHPTLGTTMVLRSLRLAS